MYLFYKSFHKVELVHVVEHYSPIQQSNENALGEVGTYQNLHFDKNVSPIGLKINRDLY